MVRELWWFVDAAWSVLAHRPESSVHSRQRFQRERTLVNDPSTTIYESRRRRPGSDVDGNWETALRRFASRTVPTDRRSTRTLLDPIYTATPDTTKQSCLCRVWRGGVNWIIAVNVLNFQISVGDSLQLSGIQFTSQKLTRHRQGSFVVSGEAVWISFNCSDFAGGSRDSTHTAWHHTCLAGGVNWALCFVFTSLNWTKLEFWPPANQCQGTSTVGTFFL